jgi:hypothetical protein
MKNMLDAIIRHNAANNPKVTLNIVKNKTTPINTTLPKIFLCKLNKTLGFRTNATTSNKNNPRIPCFSYILYK